IKECNSGVYLFDAKLLQQTLKQLRNRNASGEFYLPDVFASAKKLKKKIAAYPYKDANALSGVNTLKELAQAQNMLYERIAERHMSEGGVFIPVWWHTYIGPKVKIGKGSVVGAFATVSGTSVLGERVHVGAHCDLKDVIVGDETLIRNATVAEKSIIGS